MPDIKHLKEQLERARRLAAGLIGTADGKRLLAIADDYQRQIDAATDREGELQQSMARDQEPDATGTSDEAAKKPKGEEPEME